MNKRVLGGCLVLFFLCFIVPAGSAWAYGDELLANLSSAKGNIRSGKLRLHLGLELRETFDDNIFNTAINETDDFITTITPGVMLSLGDRNKIELGYAAGIHFYSDHSAEDFVSEHGRALVSLKSPSGLRFEFLDVYLQTEDPRPEELQLRASHWTNDIDASLGYEFPAQKLMVEALYKMRYLKYDQSANRSFNKVSNVIGVAAYYKFLPKTAALVEYRYGVQDFFDSVDESTDKDAKLHTLLVGLRWDATAKLSGSLKTGWSWKKYDNTIDVFGNPYIDENLWSVEGQLSYKVSDRTRLDLGLNRSLEDTEYGGSAVYSRATNYMNTGATVGVEHKITPKLLMGANVGFQSHEYNRLQLNRTAREDDIVDFGVGVSYDVRDWLKAAIKYTFSENDSDDSNRDERHNKVFISLTAAI